MQDDGQGGDGPEVSSPGSEDAPAPLDEAWWPLWVAPWGTGLGLVDMVVSYERKPNADEAASWLLAALVVMLAGLLLYGLMLKIAPSAGDRRLRRWLAGISTAVAFVGLTAFFGGFFLATMDWRTTWLPGLLSPEALIGLSFVLCVGWAPILLVVALLTRLIQIAGDRDAAESARSEGVGS